MSYSVVWFKRDLRVHDHAPLLAAAQRGPVLCLYILEPSLWRQADYAVQHYHFLRESLRDLALQLRACGASLELAVGEACEVLERLFDAAPFAHLYSHQETGNDHSFQRDIAVGKWCKKQQVVWQESAQHAVVRALASQDDWDAAWSANMCAALLLGARKQRARTRESELEGGKHSQRSRAKRIAQPALQQTLNFE